MKKINLPAIWLIILIVGLPLLSETVYTPSLPDIAHALSVTDAWVEYTLTIYLFGFAIGTLFWGNLSDKWGRKPCILLGLSIFIVGCIGCYASDSISLLMISRFIQAFGGSTGSVLGQAVCRDAYHGPALGKLYATVGGLWPFSPPSVLSLGEILIKPMDGLLFSYSLSSVVPLFWGSRPRCFPKLTHTKTEIMFLS